MSAAGQIVEVTEGEVITPQPHPGAVRRALAIQANKWKPGQSGNPGGKSLLGAECARLARDMCPEALARAAEIMRQTDDERAALVAIGMILDRGLGKPKEIKQEDQALRPDLSSISGADLAVLRRVMYALASDSQAEPVSQAEPAPEAATAG